MKRNKSTPSPAERFPPSAACSCDICRGYCARPGWWSVEQAQHALLAGYGTRMMLELSPDRKYGVLSPAFRGCEGRFALQEYAKNGCTFFRHGLCALFQTGFEPIECRFCHHDRPGQGRICHSALAQDWQSSAGQTLVQQWIRLMHCPAATRQPFQSAPARPNHDSSPVSTT